MDRETYLEHRDRAGEGHDTERCPICRARRRTIEETIRMSKRVRAAIKATFRQYPTIKGDIFIGR
jgi:hypothetical protein